MPKKEVTPPIKYDTSFPDLGDGYYTLSETLKVVDGTIVARINLSVYKAYEIE